MIDEWFRDALQQHGHRRLSDLNAFSSFRLSSSDAIERLQRMDMRHVFRAPVPDSFQRSTTIMTTIAENDTEFEREWTSFRSENEVVFVFRSLSDAVHFTLLWG